MNFTKILQTQKDDLLLFVPIFFIFGVIFSIKFEYGFEQNLALFFFLSFLSFLLHFLNRENFFRLVNFVILAFLCGCFYVLLYQKIFSNHTKITGKVFVEVEGRVESAKKFHNPVNKLDGLSLVIVDPVIYELAQSSKKKKSKRHKKITPKTIEKNFLNLANYQEIDRKFLDYSKNYQQINWQEIDGKKIFPNPPKKIFITVVKIKKTPDINDIVTVSAMLQVPQKKEFKDDFDFSLYSQMKKIGAYGYALSEVKILQKSKISNLNQWFLNLREKIKGRIRNVLNEDEAAVSEALLIGDKSQISKDLSEKIRNSGLAHLLSISGFHLALAGAIFFVSLRFLLARNEYLALNFDLKKISAFLAVFASYFYLKISGESLPAQRAFLMIFLVFLALFFSERINARRAIVTISFLLILANPFSLFSISFQLSFVAVLVILFLYDEVLKKLDRQDYGVIRKVFFYLFEIILISIFVQIATLPFLMNSFQTASLLGFIANILAIPLVAFTIMPLGFLSLFLMPIALEKYSLILMGKGINWLQHIASTISNLDYSHFYSAKISNFGLIIATVGILLTCLIKSRLRFVGIIIFLTSFLTLFFHQKPDILFDNEQKFFALYDEKEGLIFSKKLRPSKQRKAWMKKMDEGEFKYLKTCQKDRCEFEKNGKKFLVLLKRNEISEICLSEFNVIVNLTAKYQLPDCILEDKIKIDNLDFYQKGGHFLFFDGDRIKIETSS